MSKIIVGLTSIIWFLLLITPPGHADGDMVCKVSQPIPENCTPYLLLEYADLTITGQDRFALQGRYNACYHSEDVTIKGRVKRYSYHDGVDLELLATEIQLSPDIIQRFPRTIGTVTLKKVPLKGYFFDTWASIRTRGIYRQDPFTRVIRCKENQ